MADLRKPLVPPVGAILLAAGAALRMGAGGQHKLLAEFEGVPLVRRSAQVLIDAGSRPVVVVTGHRHAEIEAALTGLDVIPRFNPAYAAGMGASLACGFSHDAIPALSGVVVMLSDMPGVTSAHVAQLVGAFRGQRAQAVLRASCDGQPGHPVVIPAALFGAMGQLSGDSGARGMIRASGLPVVDIDIGPAALCDVDTPEAVIRAGGVLTD